MEKYLIVYFVPAVVIALSIPMIRGKVAPNSSYGFRTTKTLESEEVWYPANRASGCFMLVAAVVSLCFNLGVWWAVPEWPLDRMMPWMVGGNLVPLSIAVVASFIYLRRL